MLEAVKSLPRIILALLAGLGFGLHARANVVQSARHSDGLLDFLFGLGVFGLGLEAPAVHNLVNFYTDGGFNLLAPLPGRDDDILGVGVGFTKVSEHGSRVSQAAGGQRLDSETVFELTYQLQLAPWWQLQPDFQNYITPSAGVHAPNAAVLGMRTTIAF